MVSGLWALGSGLSAPGSGLEAPLLASAVWALSISLRADRTYRGVHKSIAEDTTRARTLSVTVQHNVSDANCGFRASTTHLFYYV